MAQLETVLRLDEKALDNTALSCFSRRQVCNDSSDITLFEDLVIGRDCDSDRLQGAGQIVLCNVLSKENSLMYVTENFDYATLCKYAAKNLMLSNSIGAVISYGNNEDNLNRTASLFKRMMTTTLIMIVILFAEDLRVRYIILKRMMISL